ncbi:MAG: DUF2076 domain-containing protein [Verrucomicrobia bacterium]|nr:DUF2076 domain-containing protein [Verrucomicrobiota bacterium]
MTPEERNLISGLFDRLAQASNQPKDPEADQLIRSKIAEVPSAPYLLVQSTIVMQQALSNAQSRIAALEKQVAETTPSSGTHQGGGFLAGVASLFGAGQSHGQPQPSRSTPQPPPPPTAAPMQPAQPPSYAYQQAPLQPIGRGGSGGFLQGALSTAAGVAGGALLFQGIENLIGHNPGPFSGVTTPSGGVFGGEVPVENTEVVNNYYDAPDENRGQMDQGNVDQPAYADPDPDPDPTTTDDFASNDPTDVGGDDLGGGDDSSYV